MGQLFILQKDSPLYKMICMGEGEGFALQKFHVQLLEGALTLH